jgi:hypothetical protein
VERFPANVPERPAKIPARADKGLVEAMVAEAGEILQGAWGLMA